MTLRARLTALRQGHADSAPVRVFYQVWASPLMTINGRQMVNDVIELCGGRNVFAALAPLVPLVSTEAVLEADPEAILTADERGSPEAVRRDPGDASFALWRQYSSLAAVRGRWLYVLNGDAISRQGPRIVDGAAAVCRALDEVRRERRAAR
jgi:iron complex transport system substrate-binding protein